MSLWTILFGSGKVSRSHDCPVCGAYFLQRCSHGCTNAPNRNQNAGECHDGLHHHCCHMPFCAPGTCKNDRRPALVAAIKTGANQLRAIALEQAQDAFNWETRAKELEEVIKSSWCQQLDGKYGCIHCHAPLVSSPNTEIKHTPDCILLTFKDAPCAN